MDDRTMTIGHKLTKHFAAAFDERRLRAGGPLATLPVVQGRGRSVNCEFATPSDAKRFPIITATLCWAVCAVIHREE
jgi:hypothetical protein